MSAFTLDSNILIYHLKGDTAVTNFLEQRLIRGERIFISAITRIELFSAPVLQEGEKERIIHLLAQFTLMPVDTQISDEAARIRRLYHTELGDSIIAATAIFMNSALVTRNIRDFKRIKELSVYPL